MFRHAALDFRCITSVYYQPSTSRSFTTTLSNAAKSSETNKADARARAILRTKPANAMNITEASAFLKAFEVAAPYAAFELSVITHFTKGSTALRGRISLPRDPRQIDERILVFADGKQAEAAAKLGAAYIGGIELIEGILTEKIVPTKVLCTPVMLPKIAPKLQRFLGPKGLMPTVRSGTVVEDISGAIKAISGTMDWKGDKEGIIRVPIGRINYNVDDLGRNIKALIDQIRVSTSAKDDFFTTKKSNIPPILRVFLSSTRGPGIPLLEI